MVEHKLSVIVVTRNGSSLIEKCLNAIIVSLRTAQVEGEVTVIDNGSNDASETQEMAVRLGCRFIKLDRNYGVAPAWNLGFTEAKEGQIIFVNQDAVIEERCIEAISETLNQCTIPTVVGAKLYFPNTKLIQHAGAELVPPRYDGRHIGHRQEDRGQFDILSPVNYVTGAVFGCSFETLRGIEGFDQRFVPAYFEDVDFCWRLRANGGEVLFQPKALGYHAEGSSKGWGSLDLVRMYTRNRLLFVSIHLSFDQLSNEFVEAEIDWLNMLDPYKKKIIMETYQNYISQVPYLFDSTKARAIATVMAPIIGRSN